MMKYCYFNGKIIPENKTHISINDIGILRGYGVFEFLRTYNGKPFLLNEHWARLKNSAKILHIKVPVSRREFILIIKKLFKKNKVEEVNIRIILTGGKVNYDGITCQHNNPTFFILIEELHKYPESLYAKGVKVMTHEHKREIHQSKTIDYLTAVQLQNIRKKKGAFEIIYIFNGLALEASTSNLFIFKGDKLITPKNDILIGTTRNFVVNFAKPKFKVEERSITYKELKSATEVFITATNKEIIPVVKVGNQKIGNGKVGLNTKLLMELFRKHTQSY